MKDSEIEVVVHSYDPATKDVTVSPRAGGQEFKVQVDRLDFVEGEHHIVDWSSTIAAFKQSGVNDNEGYSGTRGIFRLKNIN